MISQAIVLKNHAPYKYKITLFDSRLGKIQGLLENKALFDGMRPGAVLKYSLKLGSVIHKLEDVEYIYIPFELAKTNIYFLHHVLELCYNFLQFNQPSNLVFNLILELYETTLSNNQKLLQAIFLCRFFVILSVYPEDVTHYSESFLNLISILNNSMVNQQQSYNILDDFCNNLSSQEIKRWLIECINTHSHSGYFKTLGFIRQL